MLIETKNSLKKLLVFLTVFAAITAVGQAWGMEKNEKNVQIEKTSGEKPQGAIENICFFVIEKNDQNKETFASYKMGMKDLPTVIWPALISRAYHNNIVEKKSSVMIANPMSSECLEEINKLFNEKGLPQCEKIDSVSVAKFSKNRIPEDVRYKKDDEFYRKNIIEQLTDDVKLPIFGADKNGKIYLYIGNDSNKRLNFKKEKFPNKETAIKEKESAYLIRGFIDNNNEEISPNDFTCVGEATTNIYGNEIFAWDGAFKENTIDKKFDNEFLRALDKQHKKDVMNSMDVYFISKSADENSVTLHSLSCAILPLKIALLKKTELIDHIIIPFGKNNTEISGTFCVSSVVSCDVFKTNCISSSEICSLKENNFSISAKQHTYNLADKMKCDNYDCINEIKLEELLRKTLANHKNNDDYFQQNIVNPSEHKDRPLFALDENNNLYLYTKREGIDNGHEKLKLIMQEKFILTSICSKEVKNCYTDYPREEKEEKGYYLMKDRINTMDQRFTLLGKKIKVPEYFSSEDTFKWEIKLKDNNDPWFVEDLAKDLGTENDETDMGKKLMQIIDSDPNNAKKLNEEEKKKQLEQNMEKQKEAKNLRIEQEENLPQRNWYSAIVSFAIGLLQKDLFGNSWPATLATGGAATILVPKIISISLCTKSDNKQPYLFGAVGYGLGHTVAQLVKTAQKHLWTAGQLSGKNVS